MGSIPQPRKIARIGLVLEMEDGGKIMVYADGLTHAEVLIEGERADESQLFPDPRYYGRMETSITITGIEAYRIIETMPAMAAHMLEALKDGTGQAPADLPPARRLEP